MARRLLAPLLLITFLMAAAAVDASPQAAATTTTQSVGARSLLEAPRLDCPKVCWGRCAKNWRNEMCNDKCNVCCKRCNCVPPGTGQDTRHVCPCYDTMTNPHNGKLKCP